MAPRATTIATGRPLHDTPSVQKFATPANPVSTYMRRTGLGLKALSRATGINYFALRRAARGEAKKLQPAVLIMLARSGWNMHDAEDEYAAFRATLPTAKGAGP